MGSHDKDKDKKSKSARDGDGERKRGRESSPPPATVSSSDAQKKEKHKKDKRRKPALQDFVDPLLAGGPTQPSSTGAVPSLLPVVSTAAIGSVKVPPLPAAPVLTPAPEPAANLDEKAKEFLAAFQKQIAEKEGNQASGNKLALLTALIPVNTELTTRMTKPHPELAAYARESRRLHVAGLPTGVTEGQLRETLQSWAENYRRQMLESETGSKLPPEVRIMADVIIDVTISQGANPFAFVEFNTRDMPSALVQSKDPITMTSMYTNAIHTLRFGRPNKFKDLSAPDPGRVVIIRPPELDEESYKQLFEQFGTVKACFYARGDFAYCEYEEEHAVQDAVGALNGQVIGNEALVVQEATAVVRVQMQLLGFPVTVPSHIVSATGGMRDLIKELLDLEQPAHKALSILGHYYPHLKANGPIPVFPTRILVLLNMFETDELEEDEDYYNLVEDIAAEVEEHGRVEELIVPRFPPSQPKPPLPLKLPDLPPPPVGGLLPAPPGSWDANGSSDTNAPPPAYQKSQQQIEFEEAIENQERLKREYDEAVLRYKQLRKEWEADIEHPVKNGIGKVFVEYVTVEEAAHAQREIAGKLFNGRTVITSFLFEDVLHPPAVEQDDNETAEARATRMAALFNEEETEGTKVANEGVTSAQETKAQDPVVAETTDDID